jgi:inner membrane protein
LDNLTHSLVGVALADLMLPAGASRVERRLFVGAGVIAANAPDLDILYTNITPPPLGYLLHHRGHTHTILGLIAIAAIFTLLWRLLPAVRRLAAADRVRLWMLAALGLASHVPLDAFNSYGTHPFHPFDRTWYYGDAVFIFEPWLWMLLAVAVGWNAWSRAGRLATAAGAIGLPMLLTAFGIIPRESLIVLVVAGGVLAWLARAMSPRARATASFAAIIVMLVGMVGVSSMAREAVLTSLRPEVRGELVDVILTPNPASPVCWAVIAIEQDEAAGEFVMWRGTVSLAPRWKAATDCASHRFAGPRESRMMGSGRLALRDEIRLPLQALRDLHERDCWVRGWLQFGRAPLLRDGALTDLRFDERVGQSFSTMVLKEGPDAARCPPNLPNWGMPRADLLAR